jgi:hypothetical protein
VPSELDPEGGAPIALWRPLEGISTPGGSVGSGSSHA